MDFDASVKMVKNHRDCYPEHIRLFLVPEPDIQRLEGTAASCKSRAETLEFEKRLWVVITAGACILSSTASFLVGLML